MYPCCANLQFVRNELRARRLVENAIAREHGLPIHTGRDPRTFPRSRQMAYVFPRATERTAVPRDGFALEPVLLGALLGAGLGVILSMVMGDAMRHAAHGLNLSLPFGAWCAGALAGALGGGLLSAWMGGEVDDLHGERNDNDTMRRKPSR
jgi:hypothetical protein